MPFDSTALGRKLSVVGEKQIETSKKLDASATEIRKLNTLLKENGPVEESLTNVEKGTRSVRDLLKPITQTLHTIADGLSAIGIRVPAVQTRSVDFPVVGEIRFVTGLSWETTRPFRDIAESTRSVAQNIDNVRDALKSIADANRTLNDALPDIRSRIAGTADQIDQGASDLAEAGRAMKEAGALLM
jgi:methyl-accepting chemotaxis protein